MDVASLLHAEVSRFKRWAEEIPHATRSGEWECDYSNWDSLWAAAKLMMSTIPVAMWTEVMTGEFLYAMARDNEAEVIADEIGSRGEELLEIEARATVSVEHDAKWQIAAKLGELTEDRLRAEALLIRFVQDSDEYVSRRALISLRKLKSGKTEQFAERAWQTGHEYQRIAALWELKDVASPKLNDYLRAAEKDGRKYVAGNAAEIRAV